MKSTAPDVDAYLAEVPAARRTALQQLRQLCRDELDGYEETMEYGMPSYGREDGDIEVAFASQARHISVYVLRQDVLDRFRDRLSTRDIGKGCIRYSKPEAIDLDVLREILAESARATGPIC